MKKILQRFRNLKIGLRLAIIFSLTFLIISTLTGTYIFLSIKKTQILEAESRMFEQVNDLNKLINTHISINKKNIEIGINSADYIMKTEGEMKINNSNQYNVNVKNQITKEEFNITIPEMTFFEKTIHYDNNLVDKISNITNSRVTIFQKIDKGFLRISTNVLNEKGERAINTFIPNESPVIQTIEKGEIFRGRAFVVDDWYTTAYKPIKINGKIMAIIFVGVKEKDMGEIKSVFKAKKYFETGYPFIVDSSGILIIHPKLEGKNVKDSLFFRNITESKLNNGKINYNWLGSNKTMYFHYNNNTKSYICVSVYENEFTKSIVKQSRGILIATILGVIIFIIICFLFSKDLNRKLNKLLFFSNEISTGNLNVSISRESDDEIGVLTSTLESMKVNLKTIIDSILVNSAILNNASLQVSSNSQQIAEGSNEQASAAQEISASIFEILSNTEENSINSKEAEQISIKILKTIKEIQTAEKRNRESIKKIVNKISIINDIAFQSNLLSLNASIEASKAGVVGRGFMVVATEVRKLAEKSKMAADEINIQAIETINDTEKSDFLIRQLLPEIEKSTKLVSQISISGLEQSSGISVINTAMNQLNSVTQQNASSSEELASNAEELLSRTIELKNVVDFFKIS